jgi:hypothetical protein
MFQMDIAEHVRLSHQSLEDACRAHADAAARLTRLSSWFRMTTLLSTAVAAGLAGVARGASPGWQTGSIVASGVAFAVCAAYVGFNQQPRIQGHLACSARLWLVCEKYRGLLAEMHEGLLDLPALRDRRNALLQEAATVFERTAPADRDTFEIARRALGARSGAPAGAAVKPAAAA